MVSYLISIVVYSLKCLSLLYVIAFHTQVSKTYCLTSGTSLNCYIQYISNIYAGFVQYWRSFFVLNACMYVYFSYTLLGLI